MSSHTNSGDAPSPRARSRLRMRAQSLLQMAVTRAMKRHIIRRWRLFHSVSTVSRLAASLFRHQPLSCVTSPCLLERVPVAGVSTADRVVPAAVLDAAAVASAARVATAGSSCEPPSPQRAQVAVPPVASPAARVQAVGSAEGRRTQSLASRDAASHVAAVGRVAGPAPPPSRYVCVHARGVAARAAGALARPCCLWVCSCCARRRGLGSGISSRHQLLYRYDTACACVRVYSDGVSADGCSSSASARCYRGASSPAGSGTTRASSSVPGVPGPPLSKLAPSAIFCTVTWTLRRW